jgi:hypothetical protein
MRYAILPTVLALALAPQLSRAEQVPALSQMFEEQLSSMETAIAAAPEAGLMTSGATDSPEDAWYFRTFLLRTRFQAGFQIPGFVKFVVVPEVEMVWQRDFPDGWGAYAPKP